CVCGIEFLPFNDSRYLCSGSADNTIRLWDVEASKSLHIFNGHENIVWCVNISPLQSNNKNDKMNNTGMIGGNGYIICSGSWDKTIRIWDIETTKQLNIFKGHEDYDKSVRLWDIRSNQQIQVFNGHTSTVFSVEYSPFVIKDSIGNFNVICSGSNDNTICFWDIRSNKSQLHIIKGNEKEDDVIYCVKFVGLKKKENTTYDLNLCYGSHKGFIRIWG
ncbi:WD-40 repeat protein, partial [Reticulomyxa filosa]